MTERRKRLTAKTKYNIFLKTREANAPIGEILREYGLHLSDLKEIKETVELRAIARLKTKTKQIKIKEVTLPQAELIWLGSKETNHTPRASMSMVYFAKPDLSHKWSR
ncbi:MAG: hypothetical protein KAX49_16505 [Halanaerobiales bacterium]|nr:hypothetical protein [Halanaerobiales bacterium]